MFVWEAYKELNALYMDDYMTFTQHDNTHGWSVDRETLLGLSLCFLHQRWLNVGYGGKTGNDNNNYMDEACRRARQINNNITVKGRRVTNQTYLGF